MHNDLLSDNSLSSVPALECRVRMVGAVGLYHAYRFRGLTQRRSMDEETLSMNTTICCVQSTDVYGPAESSLHKVISTQSLSLSLSPFHILLPCALAVLLRFCWLSRTGGGDPKSQPNLGQEQAGRVWVK